MAGTSDPTAPEASSPVEKSFEAGSPSPSPSKQASTLTLTEDAPSESPSHWRRVVSVLTWTPRRLRYDPSKPPEYSIWLNLLFGAAGMATVANLYYSHPILNILARDFGVSDEESARIPTLAQGGYAAGLLFLNPIGDGVRRRPFVLALMLLTSLLWIGLCVTPSFRVFGALTFLTSVTTVTPQIMLPLVADLAPIRRRATAVSIVTSGLLLGLLFARVMSGVVTQFVAWRYVYWIALALQLLLAGVLWAAMPDYPRTDGAALASYRRLLWSIARMLARSPLLLQACVMGFFTAACFTSFWTTLTFLLAGAPYRYSPVVIGCFALIGVVTMLVGPIFSRFFIDRYVPLVSAVVGVGFGLLTVVVGTFTGSFSVAGPVVMAVGIDLGFQISQIANRSSIYGIDPKARNRVNTAYMVFIFVGQLMGTSVGNRLYAQGGWVLSGSASIGFMGAALLVCFVRGPWEEGWVGWSGGWSVHRRDVQGPDAKAKEVDVEQQRKKAESFESPQRKKEEKETKREQSQELSSESFDTKHADRVRSVDEHETMNDDRKPQ